MNISRFGFAFWGWLMLCGITVGCGNDALDRGRRDTSAKAVESGGKCERIVSLAPSITEMLIALELGPSIVGVTRYCAQPHDRVSVIGGYSDPSYERILTLKPDLVAMLDLHAKQKRDLEKIPLQTVSVRSQSIDDILDAIHILASHCGVAERGNEMVKEMNREIHDIQQQSQGKPRPRVLMSVGRTMGTGSVQDIFVAGKTTWLSDLIDIAGGINAIEGSGVQYPKLSAEGVMQINPEVIIELIPVEDKTTVSNEEILSQWQIASQVEAVKHHRIHVLRHKNIAQPGPGVVDLARILSRLIHSENGTSTAGLIAPDARKRVFR
jgi:iron complex transport system substrate-binding protein